MHLAYFDENKYSEENPYFVIGGIIISDKNIVEIESILTQIQINFFGSSALRYDTEFHGKELLHGKAHFKKRKLPERLSLFQDLISVVIGHKIPVRLVRIDVTAHREKYRYARPEYSLGLMLILERFCTYLEKVDDYGLVFGDYEKDEMKKSVLHFSEFKGVGKTPMNGRSLNRLIDTIYYTHSFHSRFLQLADIIVFLAGRYSMYDSRPTRKWYDGEMYDLWEKIKANTDFYMQRWP